MLEDRVLIEDPKVLAEPYRVTFRYKRSRTYKIQEYVCTDNHYHVNAEGKVIFDLGQQH